MNELLRQLSLKAHVKIANKFIAFFNAEEVTRWILKAEHCTHRGFFFEKECNSLDDLERAIQEAISEMENLEKRYEIAGIANE